MKKMYAIFKNEKFINFSIEMPIENNYEEMVYAIDYIKDFKNYTCILDREYNLHILLNKNKPDGLIKRILNKIKRIKD